MDTSVRYFSIGVSMCVSMAFYDGQWTRNQRGILVRLYTIHKVQGKFGCIHNNSYSVLGGAWGADGGEGEDSSFYLCSMTYVILFFLEKKLLPLFDRSQKLKGM